MFDIGFSELIIIGVVALLVIGPERLPGAVRTASAWLNRFRRGFNEIKQEVQQELHNDEIMRDLRESRDELRRGTESLRKDLSQPLEDTRQAITGNPGLDPATPATSPGESSDPATTTQDHDISTEPDKTPREND